MNDYNRIWKGGLVGFFMNEIEVFNAWEHYMSERDSNPLPSDEMRRDTNG